MSILPTLASEHGAKMDAIMVLAHVLMGVVLLGWFIYFFYVLWRFRKARNPQANYGGARSHASHVVEIMVFSAEVTLLGFFSIPFLLGRVSALQAAEENAVKVRIVAQQFQWNVHYPGADGQFGGARVDLIDDVSNPLGLDPEDPLGRDDIFKRGELVVEKGRPVLINLSAKDVIHSLALTEFRVKQDAIPGMSIPVSFTPTMSTAEFRALKGQPERNFEIACAQLCGQGHYNMRGTVRVLEPAEFAEWLAENAPKPGEEEEYDPLFN